MQSQIDPELPEETSGPNIGKILVSRLRLALGFARDESSAHGTAIEGLQESLLDVEEQLALKLPASAADGFATSEQGEKADQAIIYDETENKYKKPGGEEVPIVFDRLPYKGPISGRSKLPKSSGVPKYTITWVWFPVVERTNKIYCGFTMVGAPGEKMKAIGAGKTNGYMTVERCNALLLDGTIAKGVEDDNPRVIQYGTSDEIVIDLGDNYIEAGSGCYVCVVQWQVAHNDNVAPAQNSGQYMTYMNFIRGVDRSFYASTLSGANLDTWCNLADTITDPKSVAAATVTGANTSINLLGFQPHYIAGITTKETFFISSTSRDHGLGSGATLNASNEYANIGLHNGVGEIQAMLGQNHGVINCAFQSEDGETISTADGFACRATLAPICTTGVWSHMINDVGDISNETDVVPTMNGFYNGWLSQLPIEMQILVATCMYQLSGTSNFYTNISGQTRNSNYLKIKAWNKKVRSMSLPRQVGYIECVIDPDGYFDSGYFPVHPAATIVTTGTGTISQVAATGGAPDKTILAWSSAVFTPQMHGAPIVIAGAGSSGGNLTAQIELDNTTNPTDTVRLNILNTEVDPIRISTSLVNGGAFPVNLTAPTNTLYIGAYFASRDGLHNEPRGNAAIIRKNQQLGLIPA
jgi:hypothetical protein